MAQTKFITTQCPACNARLTLTNHEPDKHEEPVAKETRTVPVAVKDIVKELSRTKNVPSAPALRKGVVIHHSGTAMSAGGSNPKAYARYHVEDKGWPCIGYHYVIQPDGTVYKTLNPEDKGYHAGDVNSSHFGVCFSGDFDREEVTDAAFNAGARLVANILNNMTVGDGAMIRHSDVASKTCPGTKFPWAAFVATVKVARG